MSFESRLGQAILVCDGAMGTMLQEAGLPPGGCPEIWNVERPDAVRAVHEAYVLAGADLIETNTFGGNRLKLAHYGLQDRVAEINRRGVELARAAAAGQGMGGVLVAGSVGPTGMFVEPLGELSFRQAYEVFAEQARALRDGGVDVLMIETMSDLGEARAAVLAAVETGLPVVAQLTFTEAGRTFTGTDPVTAVTVFQALGAAAVGANCSLGPAELIGVVRAMAGVARVPVGVLANAGLPRLVGDRTVFPMGPEEFAAWGPRLAAAGAALIGGCCGTNPDYIRLLKGAVAGVKPRRPEAGAVSALASRGRTIVFTDDNLPVVIGERINPTGRKALAADIAGGALADGAMPLIRQEVRAQVVAGAAALDVNVGVPGIDEVVAMRRAVLAVQETADVPLSLDSSTPAALEGGLEVCVGKALVNSASGEEERLARLLPLAKRFGAALVVLALDEDGIPATARGRLRVVEKVLAAADRAGFRREDIFIDCLSMAVGADQSAARETLEAVRLVKREFGLRTVLGVSNVSFGMPDRRLLNTTFLTMAVSAGLDAAIINPRDQAMMDAVLASRVLLGRDRDALTYIEAMGKRAAVAEAEPQPGVQRAGPRSQPQPGTEPQPPDHERTLRQAVLEGDKEGIVGLVESALAGGYEPLHLLNQVLIPAIEEVGRLFGEGVYFLPQLMLSAEAMKRAFTRLKPELARGRGAAPLATIVMATVEGDIHDIGKNICSVLLENHGFRIVDLGRDVPAERILQAVREEGADMVGLSALMTTTMPQMKRVIELLEREGIRCPVIIGGAATDAEYAGRIGAAGHARDASTAVELAKRVLGLVHGGAILVKGGGPEP